MVKNRYIIIFCIFLCLGIAFTWRVYQLRSSSALFHNLGNIQYENFITQGAKDITLLQQSLDYYGKSLNILFHTDTQYNYNYVEDLLKQHIDKKEKDRWPEKQEQKENQNSSNQEGSQQSGKQEDSIEGEEESIGDEKQKQQTGLSERSDQYYLDKQDEISEMSQEQEQQMNQYIEDLKKQQKQYQGSYNKKSQNSSFQSIFDSFFGEIDRGSEKDW